MRYNCLFVNVVTEIHYKSLQNVYSVMIDNSYDYRVLHFGQFYAIC